MLVQHLVVLEAVQQRGRRPFQLAGEEDRRAGHQRRLPLRQIVDEELQRDLVAAGLFGQPPPSGDPDAHQPRKDRRHGRRDPAAVGELAEIGDDEPDVDER